MKVKTKMANIPYYKMKNKRSIDAILRKHPLVTEWNYEDGEREIEDKYGYSEIVDHERVWIYLRDGFFSGHRTSALNGALILNKSKVT